MTRLLSTAVAAAAALAASFPARAQTASHALVVAGQARATGGGIFACATSGPQAREGSFFNTGVGLPTEGYASCSLSGGIDDKSNLAGPSVSSQSVTLPLNGSTATLTANATAAFDSLRAKATGSFDGFGDSRTYSAAEAAAYSNDVLPVPISNIGSIQLKFDIDGSAAVTGTGTTLVFLNYQLNGGPIYSALRGFARPGDSSVNAPGVGGGTLPGFTAGPGGFSGMATDVPTLVTPVTPGAPIDLRWGLYVASYPSGPAGLGVANVDFASTIRLSSFLLFDLSGAPIDIALTGQSGTIYDKNGAHLATTPSVPEPDTWALLIVGFAVTGGLLRRRRGAAFASLTR